MGIGYPYPSGGSWYIQRSDGLDQITWVAFEKILLPAEFLDLISLEWGLCIHIIPLQDFISIFEHIKQLKDCSVNTCIPTT